MAELIVSRQRTRHRSSSGVGKHCQVVGPVVMPLAVKSMTVTAQRYSDSKSPAVRAFSRSMLPPVPLLAFRQLLFICKQLLNNCSKAVVLIIDEYITLTKACN